ncbi:hypothetical protein Efla_001107 [Eimeria flavescens]
MRSARRGAVGVIVGGSAAEGVETKRRPPTLRLSCAVFVLRFMRLAAAESRFEDLEDLQGAGYDVAGDRTRHLGNDSSGHGGPKLSRGAENWAQVGSGCRRLTEGTLQGAETIGSTQFGGLQGTTGVPELAAARQVVWQLQQCGFKWAQRVLHLNKIWEGSPDWTS